MTHTQNIPYIDSIKRSWQEYFMFEDSAMSPYVLQQKWAAYKQLLKSVDTTAGEDQQKLQNKLTIELQKCENDQQKFDQERVTSRQLHSAYEDVLYAFIEFLGDEYHIYSDTARLLAIALSHTVAISVVLPVQDCITLKNISFIFPGLMPDTLSWVPAY